MRKLLVIFAALSTLALAGCITDGVGTTSGLPASGVLSADPTVNSIQQTAVQVCGFLPAASTVAGIITSFTGGGAIASLVGDVASSICGAVVPKRTLVRGQVRQSRPSMMVNGVRVRGKFVR